MRLIDTHCWLFANAILLCACGGGQSATTAGTGSLGTTSSGVGGAGQASSSSGNGPASGAGGVGASGAGGAGAGGVGAGAGGAGVPAHTVTACPAGVDAVGKWETITPPALPIITDDPFNSDNGTIGVIAVSVDPQNPATVYTSGDPKKLADGLASAGIFKSTDCGATWVKIDTGRNHELLETGSQWATGIVIDPSNSQVMYTESGYGAEGLWKSTDGGVDWDQLLGPDSEIAKTVQYNFVQNLTMDPVDPAHLVITFHADCTGAYGKMCMADSRDAGATWHLFKGPTSGWEEGGGALILGPTTYLYTAFLDGLFYTSDAGATWKQVAMGGSYQLYRSADGTMYVGSAYGIVTSKDGANWTVLPNSPKATNIIGDGTNLYASYGPDTGGQPFWTAPESDPSSWTNIKTPIYSRGAGWLDYDRDHHILYAAALNAGLLRVVTSDVSVGSAASAGGAE